jgi:hypothetical protein
VSMSASMSSAVPAAAAAASGIGAGAAWFMEVCCVGWVHCSSLCPVLFCGSGGVVEYYFGSFEKSSPSAKKIVCLSRMGGWFSCFENLSAWGLAALFNRKGT